MIDRRYYCDLCRDTIRDDISKNGLIKPGIGLYWNGKKIEGRDVSGVEHHVCMDCLKNLHALGEQKFNEKLGEVLSGR